MLKVISLALDRINDSLVPLQTLLIVQYPRDLSGSHAKQQKVHTGEEHVLWANHKAPSCPDQSRGHERGVLREGDVFGGTGKVCGAGEDEAPL